MACVFRLVASPFFNAKDRFSTKEARTWAAFAAVLSLPDVTPSLSQNIMHGYDAASYSFYADSDYSFYGDKPQSVMAAMPQPANVDQRVDEMIGAAVDALFPHAASRSVAWRAQMTLSQFERAKHALQTAGLPILSSRVMALPSPVVKIALFVTRQEESPRAILEWCKAYPEKAVVCGGFSTNASLEPLFKEYGVRFFVGGEQRLHDPDFFASVGMAPDLIVLARYMRILPHELVSKFPHRIINVHHALLPAFIGANTYERAMERGVRIMGATAHYVTDCLDEGPIICQQTFDVNHTHNLDALKRHGAQFEALALRNAVSAHVEHRLLPVGSHVIRFS